MMILSSLISYSSDEGSGNVLFFFLNVSIVFFRSGTVSGLPLYVNYGSVEDFQLLKNNGTEFKGKVCIARYGKVFRYFLFN